MVPYMDRRYVIFFFFFFPVGAAAVAAAEAAAGAAAACMALLVFFFFFFFCYLVPAQVMFKYGTILRVCSAVGHMPVTMARRTYHMSTYGIREVDMAFKNRPNAYI